MAPAVTRAILLILVFGAGLGAGWVIRGVDDAFVAAPTSPAPPPAATEVAERRFRVSAVSDGDTFWVEGYDGERTKCRFVTIDAPERGQPGYREATEALRELIQGETVTITFSDPKGRKRDGFGRLLVSVTVGEVDVEQELLRRGLAKPWRD